MLLDSVQPLNTTVRFSLPLSEVVDGTARANLLHSVFPCSHTVEVHNSVIQCLKVTPHKD